MKRTDTATVVRRVTRDDEGHVIVVLGGEIDVNVVAELRARLDDAFLTPPTSVLIDGSEVQFIDSTAIGALVHARNRCVENDAPFSILASPIVRRVLTVTGLDDLIASADA